VKTNTANLKRKIIELFDIEAVFKPLMQPHDMRGRNKVRQHIGTENADHNW